MAKQSGRGGGNKSARAGVIGSALESPTIHMPITRRDYAKPAYGAENPLANVNGNKPVSAGFGRTGLTGET